MSLSLRDIAKHIGARLFTANKPLPAIDGYQTLMQANGRQIAFIYNAKYLDQLKNTKAAAVILSSDMRSDCPSHCLVMANPRLGFARLTHLFSRFQPISGQQIHSSACVDETLELPSNLYIGANVVIEAGVQLGEGVRIEANSFIATGVSIGAATQLEANVSILANCCIGKRVYIAAGTVIGAEGFGYEWDEAIAAWVRLHHAGRVVLEDDVDIGANCSIDRGTISDTIIRKGAKLDNLVMISHNCDIGESALLAGQTGMAGQTHLGRKVTTGGQVGFAGQMHIADEVRFSGKAMVTGSIAKAHQDYAGYPAQPAQQWRREIATLRRIVKQK